MWHEGTIGIPTKDGGNTIAHYWVKAFDKPSEEYGINGGKISKLSIKIGKTYTANYDRGWDIRPAEDDEAMLIRHLYMITEAFFLYNMSIIHLS